MAFQEGDAAYIIENNLQVTPVLVVSRSGELYTVALSRQCWIRVREGRLFRTEEEANKKLGHVPEEPADQKAPALDQGYKTPYHYDNHRSPYGI